MSSNGKFCFYFSKNQETKKKQIDKNKIESLYNYVGKQKYQQYQTEKGSRMYLFIFQQ